MTIRQFLKRESASGIMLFFAALLAFILNNSPLAPFYTHLFTERFLFWINDGLMVLFFLLVGLELKREFLEGELASFSKIMLPGVAALGGMIIPACLYLALNIARPDALGGWAIPVATDIAFALGVLSLFGQRVPVSLKLFLMALAIFDDLGAIIIIVLFHTENLSYDALWLALIPLTALLLLYFFKVRWIVCYLLIGFILWICVLHSGIHPTIVGVVLALLIPCQISNSPLHRLEEKLHPFVAFAVMPLFALANAGLSLHGLTFNLLADTITLGVIVGLVLGKQLGVLSFTFISIKLKWPTLPEGARWPQLYGVAVLCGIGFTMSLFLGTLAFDQASAFYLTQVRLGVLAGSLLSGLLGAFILYKTTSPLEHHKK